MLLDLEFNIAPKLLHRPKKRFFRTVHIERYRYLQDFVFCALAAIPERYDHRIMADRA